MLSKIIAKLTKLGKFYKKSYRAKLAGYYLDNKLKLICVINDPHMAAPIKICSNDILTGESCELSGEDISQICILHNNLIKELDKYYVNEICFQKGKLKLVNFFSNKKIDISISDLFANCEICNRMDLNVLKEIQSTYWFQQGTTLSKEILSKKHSGICKIISII